MKSKDHTFISEQVLEVFVMRVVLMADGRCVFVCVGVCWSVMEVTGHTRDSQMHLSMRRVVTGVPVLMHTQACLVHLGQTAVMVVCDRRV